MRWPCTRYLTSLLQRCQGRPWDQHANTLPGAQHSTLLGLWRTPGEKGTAEGMGALELWSFGEGEHTPRQARPWLQTTCACTPLSILDSMALTT